MNGKEIRKNIDNSKNDRMMDRMFNVATPYMKPHQQLIDNRFMMNTRSKDFVNNTIPKEEPRNDLVNLDRMSFNSHNMNRNSNQNQLQDMHFASYTTQHSMRNRENGNTTRGMMIPSVSNVRNSTTKAASNKNVSAFDRSIGNNQVVYKERINEESAESANVYKNMNFAKFDPSIRY